MIAPRPTAAFVTYEAVPGLHPDDRLAAEQLAREGVAVEAVPWSAESAPWQGFAVVLLRSCWDYYLRPTDFLDWVGRLDALGANLWNPPSLIRWNADKRYLRTLAEQGVPVIPTARVDANAESGLAQVLDREGWSTAVLKPAVSASGYETRLVTRSEAARHDAAFRRLAGAGGALVQPFVAEVRSEGEWSLIFFQGGFSHAVLKRPAAGDFRTQAAYGGVVRPAAAAPALQRQAERAVAALPGPWLYARVDGCVVGGELLLMELEVIEPSLFLGHDAAAPARLARAVRHAIAAGRPAAQAPA